MKTFIASLVFVLLIVFVLIQFIPGKSYPDEKTEIAFRTAKHIDKKDIALIQNLCADCHSYGLKKTFIHNVSPFSWYVGYQIQDATSQFNLSEWSNYSHPKKIRILEESLEEIEKSEMPPRIYRYFNNHYSSKSPKILTETIKKLINHYHKEINKSNQVGRFYKDFDLILHSSFQGKNNIIKEALNSKYSGCGIIIHKQNKPYVLEVFGTVKYTPFKDVISTKDSYLILRLKDYDQFINNIDKEKVIQQIEEKFFGKYYDFFFEWSNERLYGTELAWKLFNELLGVELCKPTQIKKLNLSDLAKEYYESMTQKPIKPNEKIVIPSMLVSSDKLEIILDSKDLI